MNKSEYVISSIQEQVMEESFKETYRQSPKSFTRNRILGFLDLIALQLSRIVRSLAIELNDFLEVKNSSSTYSKQAFSKARKNLKHEAFIALNQKFIEQYYSFEPPALYRGIYQLVAVDGSLCQLPESKELADHFGRWKNQHAKGMLLGRASILYDLLNQIVLDACLADHSIGETTLFKQHLEVIQQDSTVNTDCIIYVMDRGYPSLELFKKIQANGDQFIARCKAGYRKEVIEFVENNPNQEGQIYLSDSTGKKTYEKGFAVRIVQITLDSGEQEYLLTNTDFPIDELKHIYNLRWGVETNYSFLKENLQLENFSSLLYEGVLQDFHATILVANLANLIIEQAQKELDEQNNRKATKYQYQINKNVAVGILKKQIPKLILHTTIDWKKLNVLIRRIKQCKIQIKPNRSFPRNKNVRSRRKFHLAKKRAI